MTRKDFELIAGVLAYCEAHCDDDKESAIVEWVAGLFGDRLVATNERFDYARFMTASLPIATKQKAERVKAQLS